MIKAVETDLVYPMNGVFKEAFICTMVLAVATCAAVLFFICRVCKYYGSSEGKKASHIEKIAVLTTGALASAVLIVLMVASQSVNYWVSGYTAMQGEYINNIEWRMRRIEDCTESVADKRIIVADIRIVGQYMRSWESMVERTGSKFKFSTVPIYRGIQKMYVELYGSINGHNLITSADYDNIKVVISEKAKENIEATGMYIVSDEEAGSNTN